MPTTELAELVWDNPQREDQRFTVMANPYLWAWDYRVDRIRGRYPEPLPWDLALKAWATGEMNYFGVVPRKIPTAEWVDCVEEFWCLWVDVDDLHEWEKVEKTLKVLGLWPSAIVFSGHGIHLYFRLEAPLRIELIQAYNVALAALVGGDLIPAHPMMVFRVPGTLNGGHLVEVLEMKGGTTSLEALRPLNLVRALEWTARHVGRRFYRARRQFREGRLEMFIGNSEEEVERLEGELKAALGRLEALTAGLPTSS